MRCYGGRAILLHVERFPRTAQRTARPYGFILLPSPVTETEHAALLRRLLTETATAVP